MKASAGSAAQMSAQMIANLRISPGFSVFFFFFSLAYCSDVESKYRKAFTMR
jgi:hypothetical protein